MPCHDRLQDVQVIEDLLRLDPDVPVCDSLSSWRDHHVEVRARASSPIEAAILGGGRADRIGYAFASGITEGIRSLLPNEDRRLALAASEKGGAHPRSIHARVSGNWLSGEKTFVTMGSAAEALMVFVNAGEQDDGRPAIRALVVDAGAAGVKVTQLPDSPICPEIPHARVMFDGVHVREDQFLPGDGYVRYLKPFRTIEDIYVHAAFAAHILVTGRRRGWTEETLESVISNLVTLTTLSASDPLAPTTHLALAGALSAQYKLIEHVDLLMQKDEESNRWRRDRGLLHIAETARRKRRVKAWQLMR